MNVSFYRPARLLSFVLAAAVTLAPAAMAADAVTEKDFSVAVVNEQDAPVVVSSEITGTALGIGSVEVEGVNVRENPTLEAAVVATITPSQQVLVLSKEGDWYRISCDGVTGFVHSDYMSVVDSGYADLGYGLVLCDAANIRAEANTDSDPIECLSQDEVVTITGVENGWYQLTLSSGAVGYVRSDLVDPTADIPAEKIFDYAVIQCAAANLRTEPDSESDKTDVLYSGSLCTLVQQVGDWYEVQYGETTGYVLSSLVTATNDESDGSTDVETLNEALEREAQEAAAAEEAAKQAAQAVQAAQESAKQEESASQQTVSGSDTSYEETSGATTEKETESYDEPETETETASSSSAGSTIVSVAKNYLGVPYVWGGTTPSGFDCSGFVQYVFRQCGYSISRTATPQYSDGTPVSYSNLQPGDLVFFERTYNETGITHVGIYIGGGEFIHAGGGCVKISSLSESYYSSRYYGACRIV